MAELLKPTDTLAQGYPKINAAIGQAEQALITSDNAMDTANSSIAVSNQALANSQSTQEQLNQVIAEGDSSVEAAQARVNADNTVTYGTLKERLDAEHQDHSSQLAQKATIDQNAVIDVYHARTPLVSLVESDTPLQKTEKLQAIIDYAITNGFDVCISRSTELEPISRSDGTNVCIIVDDGSTGNYRKGIRIFGKQNVVVSTNNTTEEHTIIRWRMANSILENIKFVGTRGLTNVLELTRKLINDPDLPTSNMRNKFVNLRMEGAKSAIIMEDACYYNQFENISFLTVDKCVWLKRSYAFDLGLDDHCSGVNRNNFYNLSAYGCKDGIILDYGDTNKFYSCSFEGLTGTAVQIYDQHTTYPVLHYSMYNTFTGITNEANNFNLILDAVGNNFIDFESPFGKCDFRRKPTYFINSGDSTDNHSILRGIVQTVDSDVAEFKKLRTYVKGNLYASNIADYLGEDSEGKLRGFNWRAYSFTPEQCTNVSSIIFNSNTVHAAFKSMGGIVYYTTKFSVAPTSTTDEIVIPLPELKPDNNLYGFGYNINGAIAIGYRKSGGTPTLIPAIITTDGLTIPAPADGWSSGTSDSPNVLLINIHYTRTVTLNELLTDSN